MSKPTMGSLFAGIGGFDLGFERAGFKTSWQVEIDPFCRKVLAKHFPKAERFEDVREVGKHNLSRVDVICGGFPCQDISNAGLRAGIEGERSGLWKEYARIIRELRPKFVVVENVAALLGRGMGVVLGDLAEIGYDAEWEIVSAADVGAPHLRKRIWIMAYANGKSPSVERTNTVVGSQAGSHQGNGHKRQWSGDASHNCCEDVADSPSERFPHIQRGKALSERLGFRAASYPGWWNSEPNVGRVAHGVPKRVDRLRGLGNAVVPQIPEMIARRIKEVLDAS